MYKKERKHYIPKTHDSYYYYCRDDDELKNPSPGFWIKQMSKNLTILLDWTKKQKKETHRQNQLLIMQEEVQEWVWTKACEEQNNEWHNDQVRQ